MNLLNAAIALLSLLTLASANKGFRKDEYGSCDPGTDGKKQKCHVSTCIFQATIYSSHADQILTAGGGSSILVTCASDWKWRIHSHKDICTDGCKSIQIGRGALLVLMYIQASRTEIHRGVETRSDHVVCYQVVD